MELWKDTKRANAQKLIDWLLSVKKDGWSVDWLNMVAFAELGSSSSYEGLTEPVIMQVLDEMSKNNKKKVDEFETIFEQRLKFNAIATNKKIDCWRFFIPMDVTLSAGIARRSRIHILGKEFTFLSLASVKRQLNKKNRNVLRDTNQITLNTGIIVEKLPNVFISVSTHKSSRDLAWKDIEPAFDALRGLIELSLGFYGWRISIGRESARRKLPHPLWMIAFKKGEPPEWMNFLTDEDSTATSFELDSKMLSQIKKKAKIFRTEPRQKSTLFLIADCLRLYSQAMDVRFRHLCFLGFWQLAEAITNSETVGGNTDKVAVRLAWHGMKIGLIGSGYKETLAVLGKKRSDIVHRGIHEIKDNDINILKLACDAAINWLFRIHKSLPTIAHIEHYYRLREMNQTDFEAIKGCVAYISKHQSKQK